METTTEPRPDAVEAPQDNQQTEQAGPKILRIRTGPTYRFPKGMKAPSGSGLTIKPDGTVSFRSPTGIPYAAPGSKPFKLPALRGRVDKAGETFERIKAAIDKRATKYTPNNFTKFNGRPCADGYKVTCTDGTVALLQLRPAGIGLNPPDDTTAEYFAAFDRDFPKLRTVCTISDSEFHLALKRSLTVQNERSNTVRLIGTPGKLSLTSEDSDYEHAAQFEETLQSDTAEPWYAAVDPKFLEVACGSWPLKVRYVDRDSPIVFEPADASWRYVVMPKKDEFKPEEFTPQDIEIETSNSPDLIEQEAQLCEF